ncbi:MAG: VWA domain-containing protein [Acidobacteriota bacterium]
MQDPQQQPYVVDILDVIDATVSMRPVIETVKQQAIGFYPKLLTALGSKGKTISRVRVGVLVFRDVYCDGDRAFEQSPFFELPAHQAEFERYVNAIEPLGGGDEPESGLEAVFKAIKSDWSTDAKKQRHIIVLRSDASAHPLEKAQGGRPANYPADAPTSFSELTDLWFSQSVSKDAKRMVIFAPDATPWTDIATHWENTIHYPSRAGEGLSELDAETMLDAIVNSIKS